MMPTSAIYELKSIVWVCEMEMKFICIHSGVLCINCSHMCRIVMRKERRARVKPVLGAWQRHLKLQPSQKMRYCVIVNAIPRNAWHTPLSGTFCQLRLSLQRIHESLPHNTRLFMPKHHPDNMRMPVN